MKIKEVIIKNFKIFRDLRVELNPTFNIIVGDNNAGKSTFLEAIHLALTGLYHGVQCQRVLSEYMFNRDAKEAYINSLSTGDKLDLPEILIELYFDEDEKNVAWEGDGNSKRERKQRGISYKICYDDKFASSYQKYIEQAEHKSLPIEYYKIEWASFARESLTTRDIAFKSAMIDASAYRYQNGSDVYVAKIIDDLLEDNERVDLAETYRNLKDNFSREGSPLVKINERINEAAEISDGRVTIEVDMSMRNAWDTTLVTCIDNVPFQNVGKGEQCIVKTNLSLANKHTDNSGLILMEEPENHLSHTRLNTLLAQIKKRCGDKQLIISTHSAFVANKLNLNKIILLKENETFSLKELNDSDTEYFTKLAGYDTLRLILSKAMILVEGPTEELLIQRKWKDLYSKLPIEEGVDVMSVRGLSFKRFMDIAKHLSNLKVAVITDNDGDWQKKVENKYKDYDESGNLKVFYDKRNELRTLEPQFVDVNNEKLDDICELFGLDKSTTDADVLSEWMQDNKTDWALKVFEADDRFQVPKYIQDAIKWIKS